MILGEAALKEHNPKQAIQLFTEAKDLIDTWIGRFDLGRAYLEAGAFAEADSEFDRCLKRRGEALELFMDDMPTYSYLPIVYYYQGRVREGLKSPGLRRFLPHLSEYPRQKHRGSVTRPKSAVASASRT